MDSSRGEDITLMMMGVTRMFKDIALLIRTADEHLQGLLPKFEPLGDSAVIVEPSTSISFPSKWVPEMVSKIYRHPEDRDHTVAFVSVMLMVRDPGLYTCPHSFSYPLVSAGWVKFKENINLGCRTWVPKMILWSDTQRDGNTGHCKLFSIENTEKYGRLKERCMAMPLASIGSSDELITKILNPFVEKMWP